MLSDNELLKLRSSASDKLIDLECFLNRIFPSGFYENQISEIVEKRVFKPRKDCTPYFIELPLNWDAYDKINDRNWRMQLQGWAMFHPIMNFFDDFADKKILIDYFFDIAQDWWNKYSSDDERVTTSRMPKDYVWYDMSVGFRALVIAFFVNRINYFKLEITKEESVLLELLVKKHVSNLSMNETFSLNNHGFFQIQGLCAIDSLYELPNHPVIKEYCLQRMTELIKDQFTGEGVHKEHSPHYHFYTTDVCKAVLISGWYVEAKELNQIVDKAMSVKAWLVDPLKRPFCVGDSIQTVQKTLSFPQNENDRDQYIVGDFSESGYCSVRSHWGENPNDSSMLFFNGAYHSKSHKHRDCLSFELFEKGVKVVCDSGKYGYRSDKYRNYFLSNRAHNTIEIDRFDILKIKPYGSALKPIKKIDESLYHLSGELNYPAVKFSRDIHYSPGKYIVITDALDFVKNHKVTSWLHFSKDLTLNYFKPGEASFSYENKQNYKVYFSDPEFEHKYFFGDESQMQGFVSENDYHYEPAPCIGFSKEVKDSSLTIVIILSDELSLQNVMDDLSKKANITLPFQYIEGPKLPYKHSLIKNIKNRTINEGDKIKILDGKSTNLVIRDKIPFQFFCDNKGKDKTVIFLPGAINRRKGSVDFQRFTWSEDMNANVVSLSDPTINIDNELSIGWFQGVKGLSLIKPLSKLLVEIVDYMGVKGSNTFIVGSSAGGFVSLKLSETLNKFNFVAINPQIYLDNYSKEHFDALMKYSYELKNSVDNINKIKKDIHVDVNSIQLNSEKTVSILHNVYDERHIVKHLNIFKSFANDGKISESEIFKDSEVDLQHNKINIYYYEDKENGHAPPRKDDTLCLLNRIFPDHKIFNFR